MAALKSLFLLSSALLIFSSCSLFSHNDQVIVEELIITPDPQGHQRFIDEIKHAKKSIHMKMFHLTDPDVIEALTLAQNKKIDIKIILDSLSLQDNKFQKSYLELRKASINVVPSSKCFSLTHEKSLIIDSKKAFITAINLTQNVSETRDFGIITSNKNIISEMEKVFKADWKNAALNTCTTPELTAKNLIWSPVNAEDRLVDLIRSAHDTVFATVENLGNRKIEMALLERASEGVEVHLIVPQCDKNKNPLFNYPFIDKLGRGNVQTRVMPHPASKDHPYMHSKMIVVDERMAYVGSINFSNNSVLRSRELGIVFVDEEPIEKIVKEFKKDWEVSIPPVSLQQGFCPDI